MRRPGEGETENRGEAMERLLPPPLAAAFGPGFDLHEEGSLGSGFRSSDTEAVVGHLCQLLEVPPWDVGAGLRDLALVSSLSPLGIPARPG